MHKNYLLNIPPVALKESLKFMPKTGEGWGDATVIFLIVIVAVFVANMLRTGALPGVGREGL